MRRRITSLVAGMLLVLPSLGTDSQNSFDGATEAEDVQGTWEQVSLEQGGKSQPVPTGKIWTYRGGRFTWSLGDEVMPGHYTTDASLRPAHLDEYPERPPGANGTRWKCIYEVRGDTLRVACFPVPDSRPKQFTDAGIVVTTYRRLRR
jgi:uncharacterized protein (TIGR03067 family)